MTIKIKLAAIIKAERKKAGYSQEQLSAKAEISNRFYQAIEATEKQPSVNTVFKLAQALELDYSALLAPVWKEWLRHEGKKR